MRVLLCDSEPSSRMALERQLNRVESCAVTVCLSGIEVIEHLEREPYDLLILDTDLPLLDGYETLSLIRQADALRGLPVTIVTNDRGLESVLRFRGFNIVDYLLKPVRAMRVQRSLAVAAERAAKRAEDAARAARSAEPPDGRPRTLIADGDAGFLDSMREILEPHCAVTTAVSGSAALNEAWSSAPTLALIGEGLGPIGSASLARYLSKLGTPGLVKVSGPAGIETELATGLYTGVVGRSTDPDVVLRDIRRFIKLPRTQAHSGGLLQRLLTDVPSIRDVVIRTVAGVFESRLSLDAEVRESGSTDVLGAHAILDLVIGGAAVRLGVQCTTDLIRQLASSSSEESSPDLRSSVGVLGDVASILASSLTTAAADSGVGCQAGDPWFASGAAAREGLPLDVERMVVEMAPPGREDRFRVVLDVCDHASMQHHGQEKLSA
ncbi:MAG: response regulator [Vicinamibacterales bacterium]